MIRSSLTLSALLLSTSIASAASQAEDAFEAYLKDINGSGLLTLNAGTRSYDSSSDTLTIQNVIYDLDWKIPGEEEQPFELSGKISIPTMHLKGVKLTDDGFSYEEWKLDSYSLDMTLDAEGKEFDAHLAGNSLGAAVTRDGFNPFMGEFKVAPSRPIGSTLDYLRPLILKTSYKSTSSTGFALTIESGDGSVEKTNYGPSISTDLANGKLGSIVMQSQSGTTTIPDDLDADGKPVKTPGIPDKVVYEVGETTYENINIAAFFALFDPDMPMEDGTQTLLGNSLTEQMQLSAGDLFNLTMKDATQSGIKASRPNSYIVPLLDQMIAEGKDMEDLPPQETEKVIKASFDLLRSLSIDDAQVNDLKFDMVIPDGEMAGQKVEGNMAKVAMKGFDKNGIKEYSLTNFNLTGPDHVAVSLGRAAVEDLEFPAFAHVEKVIIDSMAGRDPSASDMAKAAPHSLTVAVNDLDYKDQSNHRVVADEIRMTYKTDGLAIPTKLSAKAKGLSVSKNLVSHPLASVLMNQLGLETLDIDKEITLAWDESKETYKLSPLDIKLGGIARLEGAIGFGGISRSYLDDPERNGPAAMATGTVLPSSLSLSDEGGLNELINLAGGMTGMGPEQVRSFASAQVQAMLSAYTKPDFAQAVAGQIQAFLANPKRLEIAISPSAPVPVAQILGVAATAPDSIPDILGIGVFAVE